MIKDSPLPEGSYPLFIPSRARLAALWFADDAGTPIDLVRETAGADALPRSFDLCARHANLNGRFVWLQTPGGAVRLKLADNDLYTLLADNPQDAETAQQALWSYHARNQPDETNARALKSLKRQLAAPAAPSPATPEALRVHLNIKSLATILKTDYPAPHWAVPGILPEGLTLLAGPPKGKKSWLVLGAGIAIATGGMALGKIRVAPGRVLYLALEDRERRLQQRAKAILAEYPEGLGQLDVVTTWRHLDEGGLQDLHNYLKICPDTRMVEIDTLAKVRGRKKYGQADYEADYAAIGELKRLADMYAVCILLVTHTRKMESEDFLDAVIGTHGLSGAADGLLVLKKARCSNTAILSITGRDIEEEREVTLQWHQPTCTWHLTDTLAEETKLTPERRRIVEILRASDTSLSSKQIAERYHGKAVTKEAAEWQKTRMVLSRMMRDGQLVKDATGEYALSEKLKNTVTPVTPVTLVTPVTPVTPQAGSDGVTGVTGCNSDVFLRENQENIKESTPCYDGVTGVTGVTATYHESTDALPEPPPGYMDSLIEALAHGLCKGCQHFDAIDEFTGACSMQGRIVHRDSSSSTLACDDFK
jgi:hypothetical protein